MHDFVEHPTEERLERFLLHQMQGEELETMETHIMACDSCVTRLEELEIQIAATKMALADLHNETVAENYAKETRSRWFWLKASSWSLAGATAALALAITIVPKLANHAPYETDIAAYRGTESVVIPADRSLLLHLNAKDLSTNNVRVELVDAEGNHVWESRNTISHDKVDAKLPEVHEKGNYLLRLYASNQGEVSDSILREFSLDVR